MKRFYLLFFLLPIFSGCKHEPLSWEFVLFCESYISASRFDLVMTDMDGEVVALRKRLDLLYGLSPIYIPMDNGEPHAEYNLHLIEKSGIEFDGTINIYSYLGIRNGMRVHFRDVPLYDYSFASMLPNTLLNLKIKGVPSLPVVRYENERQEVTYHQSRQLATCSLYTQQGATVYVRITTANETRQALIPPVSNSNEVVLNWADLKQDAYVTRDIDLPSVEAKGFVRHSANLVAPDFSAFIPLLNTAGYETSTRLTFAMPTNVPAGWQLHGAQKVSGQYHLEGLFPQNGLATFSDISLRVKGKGMQTSEKYYVSTSGPVDLISLKAYTERYTSLPLQWSIKGKPRHFYSLVLPKIEEYLPLLPGITCSSLLEDAKVSLYYLPGYSEIQLAEGYPWKSTAAFPYVQNKQFRAISAQ